MFIGSEYQVIKLSFPNQCRTNQMTISVTRQLVTSLILTSVRKKGTSKVDIFYITAAQDCYEKVLRTGEILSSNYVQYRK